MKDKNINLQLDVADAIFIRNAIVERADLLGMMISLEIESLRNKVKEEEDEEETEEKKPIRKVGRPRNVA
jgi:hypothetical protein